MLGTGEVVRVDGVVATSALRTVRDVLLTTSYEHGVVMLDHVLRRELLELDALRLELDGLGGHRGVARARRSVEFADGRSESPGESLSRLRMADLRAPSPELQHEIRTDSGLFRADFWWPHHGVVGEFDGRVKYGANDPDALWREKRREDAIRRAEGVMVARWTSADLGDLARFASILRAAGLPLG
jgi:hypothetical protein